MNSVGDALRSGRLRRGLKLEEVAAETKVRRHFLEAMENDQFDRLPGNFFALSFLRQYAHTLGLDEDELIRSFQQEFAMAPEPLPAPAPRRPTSWPPQALIWLTVGMLALAGLYYSWHTGQGTASRVIENLNSKSGAVRARLPAVANDTGAVPGGPRVMRVAFSAIEPVWMSVSSDGVQTYSGMLEGQQSKELDASRIMRVLVGNAGGLSITLNGKPVPQIGQHGQIRLLELTPEGARFVPRTPVHQPTPEDRP
jgi:transcriptional regulator with XRE-family HTH domain